MVKSRYVSRDAAVAAFVKSKADVDAILARLVAHSADHFGKSPDEINWGDVGAIDATLALLRVVSDSNFGEGEYA